MFFRWFSLCQKEQKNLNFHMLKDFDGYEFFVAGRVLETTWLDSTWWWEAVQWFFYLIATIVTNREGDSKLQVVARWKILQKELVNWGILSDEVYICVPILNLISLLTANVRVVYCSTKEIGSNPTRTTFEVLRLNYMLYYLNCSIHNQI